MDKFLEIQELRPAVYKVDPYEPQLVRTIPKELVLLSQEYRYDPYTGDFLFAVKNEDVPMIICVELKSQGICRAFEQAERLGASVKKDFPEALVYHCGITPARVMSDVPPFLERIFEQWHAEFQVLAEEYDDRQMYDERIQKEKYLAARKWLDLRGLYPERVEKRNKHQKRFACTFCGEESHNLGTVAICMQNCGTEVERLEM